MTMTPRLRKFALTVHVTSSIGWLGAVASFLTLALAGLTSQSAEMVRATYLAMELTGWYVVVPFCLAALLSGLVMSLGTPWGLFRHYWVLVKFLITVISALILFGFTQTLSSLGDLAADATLSMPELRNLNQSPALHSGGGLLAILVATILAVYKPWGMTSYGRRKRDTAVVHEYGSATSIPWRLYLLLGIISLILLFLVIHLINGGPRGH
jgi:ABC-type transport system involved in multi-copper enzyme maturation permease subunit